MEIQRKMEEVFDAAQHVQDLVMELGALVAQSVPEPKTEESTPAGASS